MLTDEKFCVDWTFLLEAIHALSTLIRVKQEDKIGLLQNNFLLWLQFLYYVGGSNFCSLSESAKNIVTESKKKCENASTVWGSIRIFG